MGRQGLEQLIMKRTRIHRIKHNRESGVTLIELAIAGLVLVFGMLSIMAILATAVGNNGRSKVDSTATMLSQAVLEQIVAQYQGGGPGAVTDCQLVSGVPTDRTPALWTVDPKAGGAPLDAKGQIDFAQAQSAAGAGYYMNYQECEGNTTVTYDVRWNIQDMADPNGSTTTYLITVGARPANGLPNRFAFALPINMRAYVGDQRICAPDCP
jgi:hypothetical protein